MDEFYEGSAPTFTLPPAVVEERLRSNRRELINMIGQAANERYAVVLDQLADL